MNSILWISNGKMNKITLWYHMNYDIVDLYFITINSKVNNFQRPQKIITN